MTSTHYPKELAKALAAAGSPSYKHREPFLQHDPEKWVPVFRQDHAQI
jgi:hypothetical protein